jgi:hypothetical protein
MDCPPILINTGVIPDLISKLLDRRRTSEIKEIETVIEIIGNASQYDDIDNVLCPYGVVDFDGFTIGYYVCD